MSRHSIHEAIILHQRPIGENHAAISLLTKDEGSLSVLAHGVRSQKSSLRAKCQTYGLIRAYVYTANDNRTLRDADVISDFFEIRQNLQTLYHAALWAEILERTPLHSGDSWAFNLMLLAVERLSALASPGDVEAITELSLRFLWRFLSYTGFRPDPNAHEGYTFGEKEAASYAARQGAFIRAGSTGLPTIPGQVMWHFRQACGSEMDAPKSADIPPYEGDARAEALRFSIELVQEALGLRLRSLSSFGFVS